MSLPEAIFRPRPERSWATTVWYEESALLETTFTYESSSARVETFATNLEHGFGLEPRETRVEIGPLEIIFAGDGRLVSLEMRTSPSKWSRGAGPEPSPTDLPPMWLGLDVAPDENGIAALEADVTVVWNPATAALRLRCDPTCEPSQWVSVADTVVLGVAADHRLCEFVLYGVKMAHLSGSIASGRLDT